MRTATKDRELPVSVADAVGRIENRLEAIQSAVAGLDAHPPATSGIMDIVRETKGLLRRELEGVGLTVRASRRGAAHGDAPHLSLDEDEVRELALEINTLCHLTAAVDQGDSRDLLSKLMREAARWSDKLLKEIEEKVGADLYESTSDTASERAETIKQGAREEVDQ